MLVSDFMANSRLKILNGFSMKFMECLNENTQKEEEKGHFLYIEGRAVLIAASANLLDTTYKFHDFNDHLRVTCTIN